MTRVVLLVKGGRILMWKGKGTPPYAGMVLLPSRTNPRIKRWQYPPGFSPAAQRRKRKKAGIGRRRKPKAAELAQRHGADEEHSKVLEAFHRLGGTAKREVGKALEHAGIKHFDGDIKADLSGHDRRKTVEELHAMWEEASTTDTKAQRALEKVLAIMGEKPKGGDADGDVGDTGDVEVLQTIDLPQRDRTGAPDEPIDIEAGTATKGEDPWVKKGGKYVLDEDWDEYDADTEIEKTHGGWSLEHYDPDRGDWRTLLFRTVREAKAYFAEKHELDQGTKIWNKVGLRDDSPPESTRAKWRAHKPSARMPKKKTKAKKRTDPDLPYLHGELRRSPPEGVPQHELDDPSLVAIRKAEDKIRDQDAEHGVFVLSNGDMVTATPQDTRRLSRNRTNPYGAFSIPHDEIERIKEDGNVVLTHNHPNGGPFSVADYRVAMLTNVAQMRATSSDGATYVMRRPADGWPKGQARNDLLAELTASRKVVDKRVDEVEARMGGRPSWDDPMAKEWRETGNHLAETLWHGLEDQQRRISAKYGIGYTYEKDATPLEGSSAHVAQADKVRRQFYSQLEAERIHADQTHQGTEAKRVAALQALSKLHAAATAHTDASWWIANAGTLNTSATRAQLGSSR